MGGGPSRRRLTTSTLGLDYFSTPIMVYFSAPIDRAEFLQCLRVSEPLHGALSSSKRLMRVFRPIVEATTNLLAIDVADLAHRRGIAGRHCHGVPGLRRSRWPGSPTRMNKISYSG